MFITKKATGRIILLLILAMIFSAVTLPNDIYAAKKKKVKSITFTNAKNYRKVIKKGKKVKLKISVSPKGASKKMKFKSSNKKVASVSKKGVIKAKKKGSAYITAYAKDGSRKKKTIKVVVGKPITAINITGDNVLMHKNSTTLKATLSPSGASYKTLTWKSSNKKIATVNSKGKVTWKKNGAVTITATANDGSGIKKKFKVTTTSLKKSETKYIAHRGYSNKAPENSLAAFELAGKTGFHGVECDVWEVNKEIEVSDEETTDGSIDVSDNDAVPETDFITFHDETLNRMTSIIGSITDMTFEDLTRTKLTGGNGSSIYNNQTIPSFEEYLDVMKKYPNSKPIIEIKSYKGDNMISSEGAFKIIKMLEDRGLKDKAVVISFGEDALMTFKEYAPELKCMYLSNASGDTLKSHIQWTYDNGIDGLCIYSKSLTSSITSQIHKLGLEVGVYTVDSQRAAYDYVKLMNVDWITSNGKLWR